MLALRKIWVHTNTDDPKVYCTKNHKVASQILDQIMYQVVVAERQANV